MLRSFAPLLVGLVVLAGLTSDARAAETTVAIKLIKPAKVYADPGGARVTLVRVDEANDGRVIPFVMAVDKTGTEWDGHAYRVKEITTNGIKSYSMPWDGRDWTPVSHRPKGDRVVVFAPATKKFEMKYRRADSGKVDLAALIKRLETTPSPGK